jgi:RNA polymerase sigma factor (sigma-70 family)
MEVSALRHPGLTLRGPTPLLRLQSDERLVTLTRRGNQAAFEALVGRYQARLLAFCRHMLGSREDAEDVLQEVFAAGFNAMVADERPINVRPWLYRIARNRSLNHLRRHQAIGVDSMDVHLAENGTTTADKVHRREEFRQLMGDVQELPETQRTALLLREIDALSYDQISEAMETTVPAVKSLLVRARVSLAEASEARKLTCEEVRLELGEVAEGLRRTSAPARRHLRGCDRCTGFRKQLKETNRALAAVMPVAPLLLFKKLILTHLGTTASAGGGAAAAAGTAAAGGGAGISGAGVVSAGVGAIASKAAAGLTAAALVTAGAVEVDHATHRQRAHGVPVAAASAAAPAATTAPPVRQAALAATQPAVPTHETIVAKKPKKATDGKAAKKDQTTATLVSAPTGPTATQPPAQQQPTTQEESDTTVLPPQDTGHGAQVGPTSPVESVPPPEKPAPQDQSQTPQPQPQSGQPQPQSGQQQQPDQGQQQPPPADGSAGSDQYAPQG